MVAKSVIVLAIVASVFLGLGFSMKIETSPDDIVATITKAASISCIPDDVNGDVKSVESIEVSKDGTLLALVRQCQQPDCTLSSASDIKADGSIGVDASQSYLKLEMADPTLNDTGKYTCTMNYIDQTNLIKDDKDEKELVVEELTAQALEPKLDNLTKRVEQLEAQTGVGGPQAPGGSAPFKNPECFAAFSVTNKMPYTAVRNQNLVLPDPLTLKGKGYDLSTGVFTAPCSGLYSFHLAVALNQKMAGTIVQVKKNSDVLFRIYAADRTYDDQASASTVTFLDKGDQVSAFVEAITGYKTYDSNGYTTFSGYLAMRIE